MPVWVEAVARGDLLDFDSCILLCKIDLTGYSSARPGG